VQAQVTQLLDANGAVYDVTNEARVHTWHEQRFGRPLSPYRSVEHAIATWPTTATRIGVRRDGGANATLVDEPVYRAKAERWCRTWPQVTAFPWPSF
jgi:hypothetical protein